MKPWSPCPLWEEGGWAGAPDEADQGYYGLLVPLGPWQSGKLEILLETKPCIAIVLNEQSPLLPVESEVQFAALVE